MTDDLYERYKEALRTGHVAVLRGRLEEAVEAYQTAASIAPARALPHASLGGVYLRLNRVDDALAEYAAAVARAPQDEGALLGQAEALAAVGRFADAATALDRVAQIQEAAGRLPEATDTIRRALELDEAPERIRRQRSLLRQIRLSAGDQAAEQALARALRLREEPETASAPEPALAEPTGSTAEAPEEVGPRPWTSSTTIPAERDVAAAAVEQPAEAAGVESVDAHAGEAERVGLGEHAAEPGPDENVADISGPADLASSSAIVWEPDEADVSTARSEAEPAARAPAVEVPPVSAQEEAEPVAATPDSGGEPAAGTVEPPVELPPSADELVAQAEAVEAVGNAAEARRLLVAAAREYAREGRYDAGLDTAQQLLRDFPSDVDVHLVLVELYISRNWETVAAEKLILLGRLADLDDDEQTRLRLCAAASQAFPDNGRLASLCG